MYYQKSFEINFGIRIFNVVFLKNLLKNIIVEEGVFCKDYNQENFGWKRMKFFFFGGGSLKMRYKVLLLNF